MRKIVILCLALLFPILGGAEETCEVKEVDVPATPVAAEPTQPKEADVQATPVAVEPAKLEETCQPKETDAQATPVAAEPAKPKETDAQTTPVTAAPTKPKETDAQATPVAAEPAKPKETQPKDAYNVQNPTGQQRQMIYYTKDMMVRIGTVDLGFYGFIKADFLGINRIMGNTGDVFPNVVPLDTDLADKKTQSLLDARSSRLGIKIEDHVKDVFMKGAIEADFFTTANDGTYGNAINSNSRLFALRLAYATAELPTHPFFFLVGQFHALLMHYPEIEMPTHVNFVNYPVGTVNSRRPQYRAGYKYYYDRCSPDRLIQFEADAELQGYNNASNFVTTSGGTLLQGAEQKWPLFCAKLSWLTDSFKIDVGGAWTNIYSILNSLGQRVDTPGWGVISNASYTWKNLILWGTLHHWVGLQGLTGNYLNEITIFTTTANHVTRYHLKANISNGGTIAARYDFIRNKFWCDVMYGIEHGKEYQGTGTVLAGTNLRMLQDFRANLIGRFWNHFQIGIEYERNYVKTYTGISGTADMCHLAIMYIFGEP